MKHTLLLALFLTLSCCHKKSSSPEAFSLHLFQEPLHLDPARLRGSSASYFFYNTLRGLYRFDAKRGLIPEGGNCLWQNSKQLICSISQYWSDGSIVTVDDYLRSFKHLFDPKTASPRADILASVKNVKKIIQGELKPSALSIKKVSSTKMIFTFERPDPEFLFKLSSTALLPIHKDHQFHKKNFNEFITNGPYQIDSWIPGQEMLLKPNPLYKKGHPQRPLVRFYFIDDEMTAYRLYQSKKLSFLRRIPSKMIGKVKMNSDFFQIPMARFDYIGFGKELQKNQNLRKALIHSINYEKLKSLLHALGRPGCPSLPKSWIDAPPCYDYNTELAQKYFKQAGIQKNQSPYKIKVSQLGGNDIKQQAEFLQHQWKEAFSLNTEIQQVEQKIFLNELRHSPPDIFRKGVGLDRPTCLNALETFAQDSKQNFISWNNQEYTKIMNKMSQTNKPDLYKKLCRKAIKVLMDQAMIIPLGEMHFSILASPKFTGWTLNSMNQLDLSQLHPSF